MIRNLYEIQTSLIFVVKTDRRGAGSMILYIRYGLPVCKAQTEPG